MTITTLAITGIIAPIILSSLGVWYGYYEAKAHGFWATPKQTHEGRRHRRKQPPVDLDGTNGVVEVKGQPCGPGAPIAPLIFALAPTS